MKAAIVKLIFQVHRLPELENKYEFDEQVIVVPGNSQEEQAREALNWAYTYEAENNLGTSDELQWEFIGLREMIPFYLENKPLALCSGSLFMEDDKSFIAHIRLKSRALEKALPLFS